MTYIMNTKTQLKAFQKIVINYENENNFIY